MSRFYAFTDDELATLWDGLTMDDGIRYGIEEDNENWDLIAELYEMADARKLTAKDPARWKNVL